MSYKPTNDVIFLKMFGEEKNKDLLQDLIEGIFPELNIKTIELRNRVALSKETVTNKLGVLDVVATLNNEIKIDIEMQVNNLYNTFERSLFYAAGLYHEGLKEGKGYKQITKTKSVWITTYNIFNNGPFHERALLKRDFNNDVITNIFELHYIQLPKFKEQCKKISTKLDEWLTFIINEDQEAVKMIKNEKIKKAEKELEYLNSDEETRELARLREKGIRDYVAGLADARSDGFEKGIEQGIKQGVKQRTIEIVKKMKSMGLSINEISEVTGLSLEEIEKLD